MKAPLHLNLTTVFLEILQSITTSFSTVFTMKLAVRIPIFHIHGFCFSALKKKLLNIVKAFYFDIMTWPWFWHFQFLAGYLNFNVASIYK